MYDVAIIGAGVVGCAIAMELSKYDAKVCVVEKEEDVCSGTSKANSAIIHAGFDAEPGTLKARLNVMGNQMMDDLAKRLDIPFKRNGALVVRTKDQPAEDLQKLYEKGLKNGVPGLAILDREALLEKEPHLADDVVEGLWAPTSGIVCPFNMTIAFGENAFENGVEFFFNQEVEKIQKNEKGYSISIISHEGNTDEDGREAFSGKKTDLVSKTHENIEARAIINASGVYADSINNQVSTRKLSITPRRGEYYLLDKNAGDYVTSTIFQLPTKMGKGVLVTPTVHGNLLVGPTAENIKDKEETNTTAEGLEKVAIKSALSVKNLPFRQVITSFAGIRAHENGGDFVIGEALDAPLFFNAAGIESPGLSSAPAIGLTLAEEVAGKLNLKKKIHYKATRKGIVKPNEMTMAQRNELIRQNPAYGRIVCRCEYVTEGEIIDAINRPLGARSLDGIKRRTRAGMGRCQAGFCTPKTMEVLAREAKMDMLSISKAGSGSEFLTGRRNGEAKR